MKQYVLMKVFIWFYISPFFIDFIETYHLSSFSVVELFKISSSHHHPRIIFHVPRSAVVHGSLLSVSSVTSFFRSMRASEFVPDRLAVDDVTLSLLSYFEKIYTLHGGSRARNRIYCFREQASPSSSRQGSHIHFRIRRNVWTSPRQGKFAGRPR